MQMENVEIFYHGENLCSIGNTNRQELKEEFMCEVLNSFLNLTDMLIVSVFRPNYSTEKLVNLMMEIKPQLVDFKIAESSFSLSFLYLKGLNQESIVKIMIELWYNFEQPVFYFLNSNNPLLVDIDLFTQYGKSGLDALMTNSGYMVYHLGAENIMWIGKSSDVLFPLVIK